MNIGLGVTTYKRPEHLKLFKEQLKKFSKRGSTLGLGLLDYLVKIHEYDDEVARKGIAYGKNQCLKALKDCDYIFLFDDDCVPIKEGWIKWFIKARKESGQHHFLYLRDTPSLRCTGVKKGIQIFNNCGGAFMFLTKEVLKTVGGFNKNYGLYGHFNFYFLNRRLMARIGQGVALASNPFDLERNFKNTAYGSKLLSSTFLMLNYKKPNILGRIGLQAGLSLVHYSNANIKAPNTSTNTFAFNVGVNYSWVEDDLPAYIPQKRTTLIEPLRFNLVLRGGVNESDYV
ncbi:hypothetical protein LCGC14_3156980, partial [marine sediment metagenome]